MAIYSTFFLAEPEELLTGFPGWKPPLPEPVRREFRMPVTKKLVTIVSDQPEWPEEEEEVAMPQYGVVAIKGRYEDYLENRLPTFVQTKQHWAAKGLMESELKPLLKCIGVSTEMRFPIYAPPSWGATLQEFRQEFMDALCNGDQTQLAKQWAAEMSTPERTHSVAGHRLSDGWTSEQAAQILQPLTMLARQARSGQKLYLLIEA